MPNITQKCNLLKLLSIINLQNMHCYRLTLTVLQL